MSHPDHSISLDDLATQLGIDIHQTSTETNHHSIPQIDTNHTNHNHPLTTPTQDHHHLDHFHALNHHSTWLHSNQPDQPVNFPHDNLQHSLETQSHGFNQNALNQHSMWLESEPKSFSTTTSLHEDGLNQPDFNQTHNFHDHQQNPHHGSSGNIYDYNNNSLSKMDSHQTTNLSDSLSSENYHNFNITNNNNDHHHTNSINHLSHSQPDSVMRFCSSTSSLSTTVRLYADGDVFWDGGGKAGHISGNTFYNSNNEKIATLGADWKIYDVHNKVIGYIDDHGACHNLAGTIVADEGTVKKCAAQLVYNVASPD